MSAKRGEFGDAEFGQLRMNHLELGVDAHGSRFKEAEDGIDCDEGGADAAVDHVHGRDDADIFGFGGDGNGLFRPQTLGDDAAEDVVLVVLRGADEVVAGFDAGFLKDVLIRGVPVDHDDAGRKFIEEFLSGMAVPFNKADVVPQRTEGLYEHSGDVGGSGDDDPGMVRGGGVG